MCKTTLIMLFGMLSLAWAEPNKPLPEDEPSPQVHHSSGKSTHHGDIDFKEVLSASDGIKDLVNDLNKKLSEMTTTAPKACRDNDQEMLRTVMKEVASRLEKVVQAREARRCAIAAEVVKYYESELEARLSKTDFQKVLQRRLQIEQEGSKLLPKPDLQSPLTMPK